MPCPLRPSRLKVFFQKAAQKKTWVSLSRIGTLTWKDLTQRKTRKKEIGLLLTSVFIPIPGATLGYAAYRVKKFRDHRKETAAPPPTP